MDFPAHLFLFVVLIGLMTYRAIQMSSKFHTGGYEFMTGFQQNMSKTEGLWFHLAPRSCNEKGVLKGSPRF